MNAPKSPVVARLLLLAVICGILLNLAGALLIAGVSHDEAISLLAATGHQGEYAAASEADTYPVGAWAPLADWQRFVRIEDRGVFARIARDLALYDIHPPLYFWLLHGWALVAGESPAASRLLGVALNLAIAALLMHIGRQAQPGTHASYALAALWLLSPLALRTALLIRQYALFALIALAYGWLVWRALLTAETAAQMRRASLMLIAVGALGLLAHYLFALVMIAALAVALAVALIGAALPGQGNLRRRVILAMLPAASLLLALLLDPLYLTPILNGSAAGPPADSPAVILVLAARLLLMYALPARLVTLLQGRLLAVAAALPIAAAAWLIARRGRAALLPADPSLRRAAGAAGGMALALWGMQTALALIGWVPAHTLGDARYLAPAAVFLPILILAALSSPLLKRASLPVLAALLIGMAAASLDSLIEGQHLSVEGNAPYAEGRVVVDNEKRGLMFALLPWLGEDSLIYAASREALIASPGAWLGPLRDEGGVLIASDYEQPASIPAADLLRLLREAPSVEPVPGPPLDYPPLSAYRIDASP